MNNPGYQIEDLLTDESFILYSYGDDDDAINKWEKTLLEQPDLTDQIQRARELCLLLGLRVSNAEKSIALKRLQLAIDEPYTPQETERNRLSMFFRFYLPRWTSAAAAILLITGLIWMYRAHQNPIVNTASTVQNESNYKIFASTDFDHRKTFILPDGTEVLLNGNSSVQIAKNYNQQNRHLMLKGEAYFKVKKDHSRPFVVYANQTATTALGTAFKVQSYTDHPETSIMLASGKVKVEHIASSNRAPDVFLLPGQSASLVQGKSTFSKSGFDIRQLQDWVDRKLSFTNAGLPEIADKLKEIYGTTIILQNSAKANIAFTGEFNGKKLSEVLDAIGFTNHFTYKLEGNYVKIIF